MEVLGIDIGGSGIKGAIVNIKTGEIISERHRIKTPEPATPLAVAETIKSMTDFFNWKGVVGCGFPTIISKGTCKAHGNLHADWVGVNAEDLFAKTTGLDFTIINDADAAGLAEINFGAGKDVKGLVIMVTIGTGIGSGAFFNGQLLPNFELGRLFYLDGNIIEKFASDATRKREDLSFKKWGKRFNKFLKHINTILSPDLIILGGGVVEKFDKFKAKIKVKTPILVAKSQNNAGIIGAALATTTR
ncbi:MAG: ROK family protein [Zetaproteobacteria bacterium]|nr:ROK family protein [Zetaproteobacteria bacterium]OIO12673.1 MAG: polyphosphate glucokinase [Flavobacteriaceae bacterium CG1_02_35_72]PJA04689.1 MAG: polyphosphate glucokinase [Flavobacteriales bacterium CG_4_10_14_0_2_um_filter_35_18]